MIGAYKITSPTGRIYVGSSANIKRREREYRTRNTDGQPRLMNSFKKHGYLNHKFEIICECEVSELFKLEYYYGTLYDVLGKNGLNCRLPKIDELSVCMSDETKAKIGSANKGNKRPDLTLINIGRKGGSASSETKEKMRIAQSGRTHPQHVKDKIKLAHTGRPKSDSHKKKLSESRIMMGKKLINNITGEVFINMKTASISIGKNPSYLSHRFKENSVTNFSFIQ